MEVSVSLSSLNQDFGSHQLRTGEVSLLASHFRPVEVEIPSSILAKIVEKVMKDVIVNQLFF